LRSPEFRREEKEYGHQLQSSYLHTEEPYHFACRRISKYQSNVIMLKPGPTLPMQEATPEATTSRFTLGFWNSTIAKAKDRAEKVGQIKEGVKEYRSQDLFLYRLFP
jgi:hypothetical protein